MEWKPLQTVWVDVWTNDWMNGCIHPSINDRSIDPPIHPWSIHRPIDEYMNGFMSGWMDESIHPSINDRPIHPFMFIRTSNDDPKNVAHITKVESKVEGNLYMTLHSNTFLTKQPLKRRTRTRVSLGRFAKRWELHVYVYEHIYTGIYIYIHIVMYIYTCTSIHLFLYRLDPPAPHPPSPPLPTTL